MTLPQWLPPLLTLSDCGGIWQAYIDAVYAVFDRDFIRTECLLRGKRVGVRRQPSFENKWFTFWHCISEGEVEEQRTPDLRRCERIPWIRPIIEHDCESCVDVWTARKNRDERLYLWFSEQYLIVLGIRNGYYLLITAYPTNLPHTVRKLRNERDRAIDEKKADAAPGGDGVGTPSTHGR